MSPTQDPRPAARYQAVSPSEFSQRLATRHEVAGQSFAPTPRSRVLRRVSAQVVALVTRP